MILVTGGAGFIGSHLVEALVARGERVRVVDDLSSGRRENLATVMDRIEFVHAKAGDAGDADTIYHLAAITSVPYSIEHPVETHENNVATTVRLLASARPNARFVLASSCAAIEPISPYAVSKLASELYARTIRRGTILRFFNVYGPRQDARSPYSGVVSIFADRLRRGEPLSVYGDGLQTRDFIYVADVVQALLSIEGEGPFNVGTGHATSVLELASTMARLMGTTARIHHLPARTGEIRHSCAPTGVGKTTLEEGLRLSLAAAWPA